MHTTMLPILSPKLSPSGVLFIAAFEGFARRQPDGTAACYDDGGSPGHGNATIGYGHLLHMGPTTAADRLKWDGLTRERALLLLHDDAAKVLPMVAKLHTHLTPAQTDALVSFAFNCGSAALRWNGDVGRAVMSKPHQWNRQAMAEWRMRVELALGEWSHVDGRVWPGLLRRRLAESHLFRTGAYTKAEGNHYANA